MTGNFDFSWKTYPIAWKSGSKLNGIMKFQIEFEFKLFKVVQFKNIWLFQISTLKIALKFGIFQIKKGWG